jgi:hypothetical protein
MILAEEFSHYELRCFHEGSDPTCTDFRPDESASIGDMKREEFQAEAELNIVVRQNSY